MKEIKLVYIGASAKDDIINTVEGNIALNSKDHASADSAETIVRTPAKIIFRFIGPDGKEIKSEIEENGFVGDKSDWRPAEIPGYRLVEDEDVDYSFDEETRTVSFYYVKVKNPKTADADILPYFITIGSILGLGASIMLKRKFMR